VFDLDDAEVSMGPTRLAPRILVDGATWIARSMSYQLASFELRRGGASAGINAGPEARAEAIRGFVEAVTPLVAEGRFLTEPGRGLDDADLAPLRPVDPRPATFWEQRPVLTALGVAVCAEVSGGLDGCTVAVEGLDRVGPEMVRALTDRGARVTVVSTSEGTASDAAGFDPDRVSGAWAAGGDPLAALTDAPQPVAAVFAANVDVLVVGSRPGVVDHEVAGAVRAARVVPHGPVPVTAKALAMLGRAGTVVLPDFVTTAGPLFAAVTPGGGPPADPVATVARVLPAVLAEVLDHERGPLLGACLRAEAFLRSWRSELPFGRPLAP
jgi:glutamate dehydrogenase/leucine dehydrogenase